MLQFANIKQDIFSHIHKHVYNEFRQLRTRIQCVDVKSLELPNALNKAEKSIQYL